MNFVVIHLFSNAIIIFHFIQFVGFIVTNNCTLVWNFIEQFVYFESNLVPLGPIVDVGINFVFFTRYIFWFDALGSTRKEEVIITNGLFLISFPSIVLHERSWFWSKNRLPPLLLCIFSIFVEQSKFRLSLSSGKHRSTINMSDESISKFTARTFDVTKNFRSRWALCIVQIFDIHTAV